MAGNESVVIVTSHKSDHWDGGDSVITAGLFALWPDLRNEHLLFSQDIPYENITTVIENAKYVVHAGTPSWLTIENRPFWKAAMKYGKHIAMLGIGLAVPYTAEMWYGAEDFINLRDSGLIDLIVCRDKFCYYWLHQRLGFSADRISVLPCPGFFLVGPAPAIHKKEVVVSLANIEETAHETEYTFQSYYDKTAYIVSELQKSGANVHLIYQRRLTPHFRDYLRQFFGDQAIHSFNSCAEFCDFVRDKEVFIGVRNHGALPFAGAGKPSLLLGTDYRQTIAEEIPFLSKIDISHVRWEPRGVLDWFHALEPSGIGASLVNYRRITAKIWTDIVGLVRTKLNKETHP
jgi:hypothetical protein